MYGIFMVLLKLGYQFDPAVSSVMQEDNIMNFYPTGQMIL